MSNVYSPTLMLTSDVTPTDMTTPTTISVAPNSIVISWTALTDVTKNGGDTPIFY